MAIDTLTPQEAAADAITTKLQNAVFVLKAAREWDPETIADEA